MSDIFTHYFNLFVDIESYLKKNKESVNIKMKGE